MQWAPAIAGAHCGIEATDRGKLFLTFHLPKPRLVQPCSQPAPLALTAISHPFWQRIFTVQRQRC